MSNVTDEWLKKDEWKRQGKNHCVIVSRHTVHSFHDDDTNRWCVYLYVYPRHPAFEMFKPEMDMWSQPNFECHSYVSLFRTHRNENGEIGSFQLGWDYSHDGDSFGWRATPEEAGSVFWDANRLFEQAESWAVEAVWGSP